ncbi:unnamed protein product [Plutella xylostella]|uniref:(diamondback moth) hypothetical protein n=1 Tax=Plutella xylostella TaxID=51655 RepID=A0A8S4G0S2_PLUXY|nr:unnamed protein product [Plutella xylostella]
MGQSGSAVPVRVPAAHSDWPPRDGACLVPWFLIVAFWTLDIAPPFFPATQQYSRATFDTGFLPVREDYTTCHIIIRQ